MSRKDTEWEELLRKHQRAFYELTVLIAKARNKQLKYAHANFVKALANAMHYITKKERLFK